MLSFGRGLIPPAIIPYTRGQISASDHGVGTKCEVYSVGVCGVGVSACYTIQLNPYFAYSIAGMITSSFN